MTRGALASAAAILGVCACSSPAATGTLLPAVQPASQVTSAAAAHHEAEPSGASGPGPAAFASPLQATLSWFYAVNHKDEPAAVAHFIPAAADMMAWGGGDPSTWSTFSALHCAPGAGFPQGPTIATITCTFNESQSPSEGNPDTFWNVELRKQPDGRWLIDNYGQG